MAKEINIKAKVDTTQAEKSTESLSQKFDKLIDIQKQSLESTQKLGKETKDSLDAAASATGKLSKGFKGVGLAIKAAGIGLVLSILSKLQEVFMSNQRVADGFATVMEALNIAFNDFVNFVINNIGAVTGTFKAIFEDPIGAMKDFGQALVDNIIERFNSLIEVYGFVGKGLKQLFSGEFEAAFETAKEAGREMVDVLTGVDDSANKIANGVSKAAESISNYAVQTFKSASANVQLANDSRLAQAQQQGLIEKYDRLAEQQRQIRDNDQLSFEARIAANEALGLLLQKQGDEEKKLAQIRLNAANAQLEKDKENIDSLVAVQEAKNELAAIEARIEGFRSEQLINRNALEREQEQETADEKKRIRDQEIADKKASDDKLKKLEKDKQDAFSDINKKGFAIANDIAGKNVKAQKAISAVQATFDTYSAIAGSLAQYSGVGAPPIPGYAIAQAIATGAFGFLQVKKILSTSTPSTSGGGSASVPRGGNNSAPQRQQAVPNIDAINQGVGGQQNAQFSNIRAYVVQEEQRDEAALSQRLDDLQSA